MEIAIVSAVRTPIGRFQGGLADVAAPKLGAHVIVEALRRAKIEPASVDDCIMGNVLQAGLGQNPARQAALLAGIPHTATATTINMVCGSGLRSIHLACQAIESGESEIIVAGGMENMSRAPYYLHDARSGLRMGDQQLKDSMIQDGLWCATNDYHMGITAENICERYGLSREDLDQFAYESQMKAVASVESGRFDDEIVPIEIPRRKGDPIIFNKDEYPRADTTIKGLAKLRPAFKKDGLVTAGNSSGINDGAAAVVLMSKEKAEELRLKPLAMIRANAIAGVDPAFMGIGPVPATMRALKKADIRMKEIGLIEANEAFSAQSLAVAKDLAFDLERVNVNGGAIALGHPIGASGARILVTLTHEMKRRNTKYGLATLCVGGGQGVATILETV